MESFAKEDSRIKIVNVKNNEAFWGNKKYSLTLGIKAAKNKRMLFTDADCKPNSNQWIKEMVAQFSSETQIQTILNPVPRKQPLKHRSCVWSLAYPLVPAEVLFLGLPKTLPMVTIMVWMAV